MRDKNDMKKSPEGKAAGSGFELFFEAQIALEISAEIRSPHPFWEWLRHGLP
jgi:hypothetical protein